MSRFDEEARTWDTPQSRERARQIASAIRSNVSLSSTMAVFEYGCDTGQLSFELREDLGPITLADSSTGMLEVLLDKIKERSVDDMKPLQLDLTSDPLPDEKFDLIYTAMTLYHIPKTEDILKNFFELLRSAEPYLLPIWIRKTALFTGTMWTMFTKALTGRNWQVSQRLPALPM